MTPAEALTAERTRVEVADFLDTLEEYLDNHSDAEQPSGDAYPMPNEAMRLHMRLTELRPTLERYAEARGAGEQLAKSGLGASVLLNAAKVLAAALETDSSMSIEALGAFLNLKAAIMLTDNLS